MKTHLRSAAITLFLFVAASAFAGPPSKYTPPPSRQNQPSKQQPAPAKEEPLCAICSRLAKETPPHAETIAGRVYDPNVSCHRELRYTPRAGGKGSQYTSECFCK